MKFIPYQLNQSVGDFKGQIQFVEFDNGVDLYRAINPSNEFLRGIPVLSINLYFYQDRLITVYVNMEDSEENFEKVRGIIEQELGGPKISLEDKIQIKQAWENDNQIFYLIRNQTLKKQYLYYSLKEYNVM